MSDSTGDVWEDARREIASRRREGRGRGQQFDQGVESAHHVDLIGALERTTGTPFQPTRRAPISAEQERYETFLEDKAESRKWERMGY